MRNQMFLKLVENTIGKVVVDYAREPYTAAAEETGKALKVADGLETVFDRLAVRASSQAVVLRAIADNVGNLTADLATHQAQMENEATEVAERAAWVKHVNDVAEAAGAAPMPKPAKKAATRKVSK